MWGGWLPTNVGEAIWVRSFLSEEENMMIEEAYRERQEYCAGGHITSRSCGQLEYAFTTQDVDVYHTLDGEVSISISLSL